MNIRTNLMSFDSLKIFAGLIAFYLLVSVICGSYFTQLGYTRFVEQVLFPARSEIWHDAAEMGDQPQTQSIYELKSQRMLELIKWQNPAQIFNQCKIVNNQTGYRNSLIFNRFTVDLSPDRTGNFLNIQCQLQIGIWLVSSAAISMLTLLLIFLRPRPTNKEDLKLLKHVSSDKADQKNWKRAIQQFRADKPDAEVSFEFLQTLLSANSSSPQTVSQYVELLYQASKPLNLSFSLSNENVVVTINDVPIPVATTPAIYWLWYAQKRSNNVENGWVLNPPSNRPCKQQADELIGLMESYGGHGRAISELKQHGLRAKTLDQNRNKIKDALLNVVGDSLVEHLGFESDKQCDNAQSIYRLKISPNEILITS